MNGERLFKQLTMEPKRVVNLNQKGRSVDLIDKRNECLFYRYYYYSKIAKIKYVELLSILSNEFFLSQKTIIGIISDKSNKLKEIFNESPNEKILQQKFNHLKWKIQ